MSAAVIPSRRPPLSASLSLQWIGAITFLILLALSKYDPTSFLERGTNAIDLLSWFWRFRVAGVFSFFDVFLGLLLGLLALRTLISRRFSRSRFDGLVATTALIVVAGIISGEISRGSQDTTTDLLFQIRNYVYLFAIYFVVSRLAWTESRYRALSVVVVSLAVAVTVLGWWETSHTDIQYRLSKYGRLSTARDATDGVFPLYAQLLLLSLLCERLPRRPLLRALVGVAAAYSLYDVFTSASKTLVALYPLALGYLVLHYRLYRRRWFGLVLALVIVGGAAIILLLSNLATMLQDPASALYVYSTFVNPEDMSNATRLNQVINFVPNMLDRGALFQGIGLGSRWYEYIPQFPEDAGAYPPGEMGTGWHLGVHVPLLRLYLDFGLVGASFLLWAFWRALKGAVRELPHLQLSPGTRACVHPAVMLIVYQITVNNLAVPKTNLFAGFLLGATSGLLTKASADGLNG